MNPPECTRHPLSRRAFLGSLGGGLGSAALASLLAAEEHGSRALDTPHHESRAKAVIQIFCPGAVSHVDTFDYKPELERRSGRAFDADGKLEFFASRPGKIRPSYFEFRRHGASGRWLSALFPRLGECVDEMAFIYSMRSKTALHGPAMFFMNSGFTTPGFPSMGSWVAYGLGTDNRDLPAFVVLPDPRGLPPGGHRNWGAGFLPVMHQGTELRTGSPVPIADLFPAGSDRVGSEEAPTREFLQKLNRRHLETRNEYSELAARIASYELAARLQLAAPEATSLAAETRGTRALYGVDEPRFEAFGRQCLLARRLVERGVRFVQIYCGSENTGAIVPRPNWDAHEDLERNHAHHGPVLDRGAAALIKDLRSRGLLDETLIICTTEFGRQPASQGGKGRDHNAGAFTAWLAGGGIRGGASYGSTDELGFRSVDKPCFSYDLNATALRLLGIDHERLTYYHNGSERRLTDVHGHVLDDLIA